MIVSSRVAAVLSLFSGGPHDARTPETQPVASRRVLIIDADRASARAMKSMFAAFGAHHCASADDVSSAKRAPHSDLIVIGDTIAEHDALDYARWLRTEAPQPLRRIPLILFSAQITRQRACRARDAGISFAIAKPTTVREFMLRLCWLLNSERRFVERDAYVGPDRRFRPRTVAHSDRRVSAPTPDRA